MELFEKKIDKRPLYAHALGKTVLEQKKQISL